MPEIREAERPTCGTCDPVHDAEVVLLTALEQGRPAPQYCVTKELCAPEGAEADRIMRTQDRARQRARKAGRAEHGKSGWRITTSGRVYLASVTPAQDDGGDRG